MRRLLAVDLDGTLITADGRGAKEAGEAFRPVVEAGIRICIATGRMAESAAKLLPEMGLEKAHIIALNGAEIWRFPMRGRPMRRVHIRSGVARAVLACCRQAGAEVQGYVRGELRILERTGRAMDYAARTRVSPHLCTERELTDRPQKLLALIEPGRRDRLMHDILREFPGGVDAYGSEPDFIEIVPPGVHKGIALAWLSERLLVRMEDVYAAGDAENDLGMLRAVGHAYAPVAATMEVRDVAESLLPAPPGLAAALAEKVLR